MKIAVLTLLDDLELSICDNETGKEIESFHYRLFGINNGLAICPLNDSPGNSKIFYRVNQKMALIEDIEFLSAYFECIAELIRQHHEDDFVWILVIPDDLSESCSQSLVEIVRSELHSNCVFIREYGFISGIVGGQNLELRGSYPIKYSTVISRVLKNSNTRLLFRLEEEKPALNVGIVNNEGFTKLFDIANQLPIRLINRLSPTVGNFREDSSFITLVGEWGNNKRIKIATYNVASLNSNPGSVLTILIEFGFSYQGNIIITDSSGRSVKYEIALPRKIYGV